MQKTTLFLLVFYTIQTPAETIFSGTKQFGSQTVKRWVLRDETQFKVMVIDQFSGEHQELVAEKTFPGKSTAENKFIHHYVHFQDLQIEKSFAKRKHWKIKDEANASPLWIPENSWTPEEEARYATFFSEQDRHDFFEGTGLTLDCADAAIAIRFVYAKLNHLPAANHLAGTHELFGNFSKNPEWDLLPQNTNWKKDERFKAALQYLFKNAYTHSIAEDVYPVAIHPQILTPGTVYLALSATGGHTQTVIDLGERYCAFGPCIKTVYATEPPTEIFFVTELTGTLTRDEPVGGFVKWRWPVFISGVWQLTDPTQMPGNSMEQYSDPDLTDVGILQRFGFTLTPFQIARSRLDTFMNMVSLRAIIVRQGYAFCKEYGCTDGSSSYDQYSTPSRDARLRSIHKEMSQRISEIQNAESTTQIMEAVKSYDERIEAPIPNQVLPSDLFYNKNDLLGRMSANPNDEITKRWGL